MGVFLVIILFVALFFTIMHYNNRFFLGKVIEEGLFEPSKRDVSIVAKHWGIDIAKILHRCSVFLILAIFTYSIIYTGFWLASMTRNVKTSTWNIYIIAMEDGSEVNSKSRRFTVQTDEYFYFYREYGSGYKHMKLSAGKCTVYEGDGNPRVEVCEEDKTAFEKFMIGDNMQLSYNVYVPRGSIQRDYTLDLKD